MSPADAATESRSQEKEREFGYSRRDFERVRQLIRSHAGISLGDSKRDMVYSRLSRRLRLVGLNSFEAYLDRLEHEDNSDEWQAFVNALTTNLTSFFREAHHFDILKQHLHRVGRQPGLTIWCAASSTGEEPYSLAMTVAEQFNTLYPPVRILATDIDTQVLDTAERGIYPLDRIEDLSPARVRKFFRKGTGANSGYCRVIDELRQMVCFRQLNLLSPDWALRGPFTAIFCRNVMIYFDKPTQHDIIRRMGPLLAADGLFFAGHSESLLHADDVIKSVGRTVYRKV